MVLIGVVEVGSRVPVVELYRCAVTDAQLVLAAVGDRIGQDVGGGQ